MFYRFSGVILFLALFLCSLNGQEIDLPEREFTPTELNRHLTRLAPKLIDATVAVMVPPGSGSGVIVTPEGLVMTAAHVTNEPGKEITVILADGRELPATTLGVDHGTDGGLLKINAPGPFPFRPYIKEKNYKIGDWVIAAGHPGGPIKGRKSPVRLGRITADGVDSGFSNPITTTTTIISGDSGGPLFNMDGEVIGINSNIGRSYFLNNHVPVPCMLAQWQPLMDSETLGKPFQQNKQVAENPFDDPYASLRKQFIEELGNQKDDPEAVELLERPRLLDPHHMQEKLDRWIPYNEQKPKPKEDAGDEGEEENGPEQPEEKRRLRPWLGIKPDISVRGLVRITSVEAGSPADGAGLAAGDEIIEINGVTISSVTELVTELLGDEDSDDDKAEQDAEYAYIETIDLKLNDERIVNVKPELRPERKLFPAPIAGLIQMRITGGAGPNLDTESRFGSLTDIAKKIRNDSKKSVVAIKRDDELLTLATVVSNSGELLAKASSLGIDRDSLTCEQGPVKVLAVDSTTDLVLLKTSPDGLVPVTWNSSDPRVASLVFAHAVNGPLAGIVTQRARISPPVGYETAQSSKAPQVWLGISFAPASLEPIVGRVDLSSPADIAGVLEGDEITHIEGDKIGTTGDINEKLRGYSIGDKITLKVERSGKSESVDVILAKIPDGRSAYSKMAKARDENLAATSRWGGELNKRRNNFPTCIYHDVILKPVECGAPLFDLDGKVVGINIARSFRHRSLAIPAKEAQTRIRRLRAKAKW